MASYRIEIVSPEDNYAFYTNLVSGQLKEDFFKLEYIPLEKKKSIQKAYYNISEKKEDLYKNGILIQPQTTNESQSIIVPMSDKKKKRLYQISFGLEYIDGTRSKVIQYSFEFVDSADEQKQGAERTSSDSVKIPIVTILTKLLDKKQGLYEVSFSAPQKYAKKIKGYNWHLTGKPEIPELDEVNSLGGPEYIYNLHPGLYYLTVVPVFKKRYSRYKAEYAYQRIVINEKYFWERYSFLFAFFFPVLIVIFLVKWQYRRIAFYLSLSLKTILKS